jgi:hypothetical protein
MAVAAVLEPLITAGLTAALRPDRRLVVTPSERITPALDVHIRTHRAELTAALEAAPKPLDWPPPAPGWFADWMAQDDARRAQTMAAGKARLALRHNPNTEANP